MKYESSLVLAIVCTLLILPILAPAVSAQEQPNYYVTVDPVLADLPQYTSIGRPVDVTFEAKWTYGPNQGRLIENATVTIAVTNQKGELINIVSANTTTGIFFVNYNQNKPNILSFNATKLVTQDGQEWTPDFVDSVTHAYGLFSSIAQVYWDTFHVSMVSFNTDNLGNIDVSVNVTRLLIPQEGLTIIGNTNVPKIAMGATVTINGVPAQEPEPGIYSASSSTYLSTAYVNVKVSSVNWTTTATGFSFSHNANQPSWTFVSIFGIICVSAVLVLGFLFHKKVNKQSGQHTIFAFYGAVTLIATCIISLYWTIAAVEASLHTFDWILLVVFGIFSSVLGGVGAVMLLRRKNPAFVVTAVMVPMIMNTLAVKASFGMYTLDAPWICLFASLFLSIISGVFVSRSELFQSLPQ